MENNSDSLFGLTEEQILGYALIQENSLTAEQFLSRWNYLTEENRNITEIVETYKIVRSLAVEKDGFDMEHFDNDEQIEKSLKDYYQNEILVAKIKQKEAELEKVADEKNLAILKLKESQKNISNLISRLNNKVIQEIEINDNSSKKKRYKKPKNFILSEEKVAKFEKLRMDAKSLLKS